MPKLTIIANIKAKPDKVGFVKDEFEKLVDVTCEEEGCLKYDLYQDNENPSHFLFFENWKTRELWQVHMDSQHLKDYVAATENAIEEFTINEMTHIA